MARTLRQFVALAVFTFGATVSTPALAQSRCEVKRQACVSECYARHFMIDPNRNKCISNCALEEDKCRREETRQHSIIGRSRNWAEYGKTSSSVQADF
jgi:hypothetical protein